MSKPLRLLNVEDSERDVTLVTRHLTSAGYTLLSERVETADAMQEALLASEWDLILCDYSMPRFSALSALLVLRESGLDIPFIIISGTIGEEVAVKAVLSGANDYITKGNLTRLIPAIERELRQAESRREQRMSEDARRSSEERYRSLFDYAPDGIIISGPDDYYLDANASMCQMLGHSHQDLIGMHASDIVVRSEAGALDSEFASVQNTPEYKREWHFRRKDGSVFAGEVIATIMPDGNLLAMIRDITDRKKAEDALQEKTALFEAQLNSSIDGILVVNNQGKQIIQNQKLVDLLNMPEQIATDSDDSKQVEWVAGRMKFPEHFVERVTYLYSHPNEVGRDEIELTDGTILDRYSAPVLGKNNKNYGRIWTFRDMTESRRASDALLESEARLRTIIDTEPECVKLLAIDGSILEINRAGLRMIEAESYDDVANRSVFGLVVEQDRKAFEKLTKNVFRGEAGTLEFQLTGLKGTQRCLDIHASPLRDATGEIVALLGITRDITESKRAETERRIIFEIIQGSITTPDLKEFLALVHRSIGEIVYADNFIVMLHDIAEDTFKYEFWADTFDSVPQPRSVGNGFGSYVLHSGQPLLLTQELKRSMIERGEAKLSGTPSKSWLGVPLRTPTGTIGVMVVQHYESENAYDQRDLEFLSSVGDQVALAIERQRVDDAVRDSNEKFHQLADNISDVFWVRSLDMRKIYYISPGFQKIWGRSVESLLSDPAKWAEFVFPEDRPRVKEAFEALQSDSSSLDIEYRILRPDNSVRWVRVRGFPVRDPSGTLIRLAGIVTDTTERKKVAEALRESEESYRNLVENAFDIIYTTDLDGNFTSTNVAGQRITGYTKEESQTMNMADLIAPEYLGVAQEMMSKRQAGEDVPAYELELVAKDGHHIVVEVSSRIVYKDGVPIGLHGIGRDITERRQAMKALQESEERYRELVENALDIIYTHDLNGTYTSVNKAAETITGYTKAEAMGLNMADTIEAGQVEKARQMIAAKLAGEDVTAYELDLIVKDGTTVPVEVNTRIIYENGVAIGVQGIARDITERKRSREALENSERSLRELADQLKIERKRLVEAQTLAQVGSWHTDLVTMDVIWSAETYRIFEMAPNTFDLNHQTFMGRVHPEDRDAVNRAFAESLNKYTESEINHRLLLDDGRVKFVQERWQIVHDDNGKPLRAIGSSRDVTERRLAEKEIELTMQRLNAAQRIGKIGDWEWDVATQAITWSPVVFELVGRDPLLGPPKGYDEQRAYYDESSRKLMDAKIALSIESGEPQEYELMVIRPDGNRVFVQAMCEVRKGADGNTVAIAGTIQDISARKLSEAALIDSEFRYHSLFENMIEGYAYCQTIWENDELVDLVYTEVNGAFATLTGLNDVIGKKISEVIPGVRDTHKDFFDLYGRVAMNGKPEKFETYIEQLDVWLSVTAYSSHRANLVAVFDNITERKRAERMLTESQVNLAKSQEIAHLGSWELMIPEFGNINEGRLRWSDEVYRIFGYHPNEIEVSNKAFFNAVHPDDRADVAAAMDKALLDGLDFKIEHRIVLRDGSERFVQEHSELVRDKESGKIVSMVGTIQDVTGQKQLEDQFRQSQKMEAVGVLAGGIAHDFNNLLTAINGYSDLTLRAMSPDEPLRRHIEEIKKAGDRAAELTSQLLAFSRKQVLKPVVHSLNFVIENIEKMLCRIIRENVELRTILDPDLGNIKADLGQIEQVIMNLAVNARDAMPRGGTLTIETSNVYLDNEYVSQKLTIDPGPFTRLTITDTGVGMDAVIQKHIFEPFFTTKEVGKGTGLGLSMVYGIVKQSGGDITVYSEPGHGTTFKIYLPRVEEKAQKPKWSGGGEQFEGTETILLVEDEEVVRRLVREILAGNGYTVLEAENGEAALEVLTSYDGQIDMLLTDVIMPKMSGVELKQAIVTFMPDIKVLFMSGYTDDSVANRGMFDVDIAFIEKPFTPDALSRKVREVLRG